MTHCPFCEKPGLNGSACQSCHAQKSLSGALAAIPYANPIIQKLIHLWKYQSLQTITPILGDWLFPYFLQAIQNFPSPPVLIPVPLHKRRLRQRGFNQAELLARYLSEKSQNKYPTLDIIKRVKATAAQATLTGSDRRHNIQDAFALADGEKIRGMICLIVDDVITTANTTEAIAALLKQAGAGPVWALTVAYGHPIKKTNPPAD